MDGDALNRHKCIHSDATVLLGKPIVKGTGLSVQCLPGSMAEGWTEQRVPERDPQLRAQAPQAMFAQAAERTRHERIYGIHGTAGCNCRPMRTTPRSARGDKGISATGIVSIAGHSPEEAVPRLSRARGRVIVVFDRNHREQVLGRRHPVPAGILHPRQVPRHPPEV